jgi:aspartyl-tRNA(Asn)/glutamyl-tRNA(Gln) amidotransferase subunit C
MSNSNKRDAGEIVRKMATLARLDFPEKDIERYSAKIDSILEYIEQLDELDIKDVEPTSHMTEGSSGLREDVVIPSTLSKQIVDCAPEHDGTFFQVPKVIDAE